MSLINQALKLEQQKRQSHSSPPAPMVGRMAQRSATNKIPLLLFGFTGMGMLLAASITAILYFGSDYLDPNKSLASSPDPSSEAPRLATASAATAAPSETRSGKIESLLGNLSEDQLSTVQQMLQERSQVTPAKASPATSSSQASTQLDLAQVSLLQERVDDYSVQGIRKAGPDTRVFLNGKIRRIGDIVDIEHRLALVGFTDTALIFRTPNGSTFEKPL